MVSLNDIKDLTLYKKQFYLPIDLNNKKNGAAITLLTPNFQSSMIAMTAPFTVNHRYYESYYVEKAITKLIQNESVVNIPQPQEKETVKVGNDGVNGAIAPDAEEPGLQDKENSENTTMVSMSLTDMGRSDPFLPTGEATTVKQKPKPPKYANFLAPPPESIIVDTTATDVMTTKVSGIMFDKFNPSAILNINGMDYLVRSGDVINGYKVLSIGKSSVTVQMGSNVYKAGVGQLVTDGQVEVNYNTVANLTKKFGGSKK